MEPDAFTAMMRLLGPEVSSSRKFLSPRFEESQGLSPDLAA